MNLELRILPIDQLKPAPYNPRQILKSRDRAYRKLEASLREFGLVEPLIWNESTGHLVGGHARLRILREMGVAEVPISVVRLSEAKEKALNVVLNNHEAQGRFDPSLLATLLEQLEDLPELELTGFDAQTLAQLRMEPEPTPEVNASDHGAEIEVVLRMNESTYDKVSSQLDELVAEYDLRSHIHRK